MTDSLPLADPNTFHGDNIPFVNRNVGVIPEEFHHYDELLI